ncbi:MAG: M15 family metallopeptidase [Erysipelotrichaceae bacterium]|nr:M15 family metallopeptidase [Erysipelotrichaceae bacterium]
MNEYKHSADASGFAPISDVITDCLLDIRYYSSFNFVGQRIDGYEEPLALCTKECAAALKEVSQQLKKEGYLLKIFDAYRPQSALDHFLRWAQEDGHTDMKPYFYPDLEKEELISQGYLIKHSPHSRGSTVDLTLFDMRTQREVDMGSPFDLFREDSHPDFQGITPAQFQNRMLLRKVMLAHGFAPLATEWWHFTLKDEPYPDTVFTFPVRRFTK